MHRYGQAVARSPPVRGSKAVCIVNFSTLLVILLDRLPLVASVVASSEARLLSLDHAAIIERVMGVYVHIPQSNTASLSCMIKIHRLPDMVPAAHARYLRPR